MTEFIDLAAKAAADLQRKLVVPCSTCGAEFPIHTTDFELRREETPDGRFILHLMTKRKYGVFHGKDGTHSVMVGP